MELMNAPVVLAKMVRSKPPEVVSAASTYPHHVVVGIWAATAVVLLLPGRKPTDTDLLKVYRIAMVLLPMV